jgi:hypothetical protein
LSGVVRDRFSLRFDRRPPGGLRLRAARDKGCRSRKGP